MAGVAALTLVTTLTLVTARRQTPAPLVPLGPVMDAASGGSVRIVYSDHMIIDSDLSGFGHAEMEAARDSDAIVSGASAQADALGGAPSSWSAGPGTPPTRSSARCRSGCCTIPPTPS